MIDTVPQDLSQCHSPVTDLFPRPTTAADWNNLRLTDQQVAFYYEHGYLAGVRMLDDSQIETLRQQFQQLMGAKHPAHHLFYEFIPTNRPIPVVCYFTL